MLKYTRSRRYKCPHCLAPTVTETIDCNAGKWVYACGNCPSLWIFTGGPSGFEEVGTPESEPEPKQETWRDRAIKDPVFW